MPKRKSKTPTKRLSIRISDEEEEGLYGGEYQTDNNEPSLASGYSTKPIKERRLIPIKCTENCNQNASSTSNGTFPSTPKRKSETPIKRLSIPDSDEEKEPQEGALLNIEGGDQIFSSQQSFSSENLVQFITESRCIPNKSMNTFNQKTPNTSKETTPGRAVANLLVTMNFGEQSESDYKNNPSTSTPKKERNILPNVQTLQNQGLEIFCTSFKNSHNSRLSADCSGFDKDCLPDVDGFVRYFRKVMMSESSSLVPKMRLSNLSRDTLQRSASSALYFFVFFNSTRENVNKSADDYYANIEKILKAMTNEEKAVFVGEYVLWYEKIPPLRFSTKKLMAANKKLHRVLCKENSTMETVVRGLLCFFTFIGVVSPSSCKSPTDESRCIWQTVKSVLDACGKRKGGCLNFSSEPLAFEDLVKLMEKQKGVQSMFHLQSWLLALFLSGTGLRIGSVRRRRPPDTLSKEINDSSSDRDTEPDGEDSDAPEDVEDFFSFDCMRGSDLRVYRVARDPSDAIGSVRLRIELDVKASKTTGYSHFYPNRIGYSYPTILPNGAVDWSMSAAIALTMLSVCVGCTKSRDVYSVDCEPEPGFDKLISCATGPAGDCPLFRAGTRYHSLLHEPLRSESSSITLVADSLQLPAASFTSRSYRSGFAKSLISSLIMDGDENRTVTLDQLRQVLNSSARWKSNQVDRYMRSMSNNVLVRGVSSGTTTALDWQAAIFSTDAHSKTFFYVDDEGLADHISRDQKITFDEANKKLESYGKRERRALMDSINMQNWRFTQNSSCSLQEKRQVWLTNRCTLNITETFERLDDFSSWNQKPFKGNGRIVENKMYFTCPVLNCKNPTCATVAESDVHWHRFHEKKKNEEHFVCLLCENGEISKYKAYRAHLQKRHPEQIQTFMWQLAED